MFEDFEGLKRRAVTMQKERLMCELMLDCQQEEISELRNQILMRDTLVAQTE